MITWLLVVFMVCNTILSALAMVRYMQRKAGNEADNVIESFLDANYGDTRMEKVWPNMMINH